jgi:hypothetical protein
MGVLLLEGNLEVPVAAACLRLRISTIETAISMTPGDKGTRKKAVVYLNLDKEHNY